jgi:hypothetical protein
LYKLTANLLLGGLDVASEDDTVCEIYPAL